MAKGDFGNKRNSNGFDKRPLDAKKGGRKPSIKNQLKELLLSDGKLKIQAKDVISIEDDGSVIIQIPTQMQLAMKLKQLAMGGKNNVTLNAIKTILEQFDGRPHQTINNVELLKPPIDSMPIIPENEL